MMFTRGIAVNAWASLDESRQASVSPGGRSGALFPLVAAPMTLCY